MNDSRTGSTVPQTALYGLAGVGFVALVAGGIWLAVYSTRYVPTVVNAAGEASVRVVDAIEAAAGRVGAAAVYLGSFFTPAPGPAAPSSTASTTSATSSPSTAATSTPSSTPTPQPIQPTPGSETSGVYPIGATSTPALYGLPDLIVTIDATGYLATSSASSFVASSTVPAGARPAVRFTVKNVGTNTAGSWRFSASIPATTAYVYQSQPQQPLNPGDRIDYTLGFDHANKGSSQMVSITVNPDHAVAESNTNNNSASAQMTILGS